MIVSTMLAGNSFRISLSSMPSRKYPTPKEATRPMTPMFNGHFVATTNIATRMTSGMIWMAVMVGSGSVVAAGVSMPLPSTRAARPRITKPATAISRIRRRSGRPGRSSRMSLAGAVGRCAVLVMVVSSESSSCEGGRGGAAGGLGEVDGGGGDGAGRAVNTDQQGPVVFLAPGLDHPGGGPQPQGGPRGAAGDGVQHGAGGAGGQGQGDAAGDGQGRVGPAHREHHDVDVTVGVRLGGGGGDCELGDRPGRFGGRGGQPH